MIAQQTKTNWNNFRQAVELCCSIYTHSRKERIRTYCLFSLMIYGGKTYQTQSLENREIIDVIS